MEETKPGWEASQEKNQQQGKTQRMVLSPAPLSSRLSSFYGDKPTQFADHAFS